MRELWRMRLPQYNAQNIESDCPIMPAFVHVTDGGLGQKFLFSSGHSVFGSRKQIVAAGFDFHKHQTVTINRHDINFAREISQLAGVDAIPLLLQIVHRQSLAGITKQLP